MKARVSEKVEQAHIVQLLRTIGGAVYVVGTHRRKGDFQGTMQTPGIPDLLAFLPPNPAIVQPDARTLLFVEAKAEGGRLRPEQRVFADFCRDARIAHVVGRLDAVINWLVVAGYIKQDSVPHYRLVKSLTAEPDAQ